MKLSAYKNIESVRYVLDMSHALMSWLKLRAYANICFIDFLVADKVHEASGWLKASASWNMSSKVVTEDTSHESSGWLKAKAALNAFLMSVTADVSR